MLDSLNFFNLPKSTFQYLAAPIQYGLYRTGNVISGQFQFFLVARRASQENIALKEQLANVLLENSHLRNQLTQAQDMLQQQSALNSNIFQTLPARIIGQNRYTLIDKGTDAGLKVDQPVIYKDSFIGLIKDVSPNRASIQLSSDPDSKIASFVADQDGKAQGVLLGQFGNQLLLDKVLHQEPLKVGDIVYSNGSEGKLPRGLVLGTVSEIIEKDNEVFKQAKIKPLFDIANLDNVFILTD